MAVPAIVLAAAVAARAVALQWTRVEDPFNPALFAIFAAASAAVIALAAGLISGTTRARVERRAIARIAVNLGEAPAQGTLQSALAGALHDLELRIAYWLPGAHRYADAAGRAAAEPVAGPGRMVNYLTRDDRRIAAVTHGGTGSGPESHLGPAIVLGLENERLQAEREGVYRDVVRTGPVVFPDTLGQRLRFAPRDERVDEGVAASVFEVGVGEPQFAQVVQVAGPGEGR